MRELSFLCVSNVLDLSKFCNNSKKLFPVIIKYFLLVTENSRLLLGVEDTVDVKQERTKGQRKEKTIKTIRLEVVFYCACPVSSIPRRSLFFVFQSTILVKNAKHYPAKYALEQYLPETKNAVFLTASQYF